MVYLLMGVFVVLALASLIPLELGRRGLATDRDVGYGAPVRVEHDPSAKAAANRTCARSGLAVSLLCFPPLLALAWFEVYRAGELPLWFMVVLAAWGFVQAVIGQSAVEHVKRMV